MFFSLLLVLEHGNQVLLTVEQIERNEGQRRDVGGVAKVGYDLLRRLIECRSDGKQLRRFAFNLAKRCAACNVADYRAGMQMASSLLPRAKGDLANVRRAHVALSEHCREQLLPFNYRLAHDASRGDFYFGSARASGLP